MKGVPTGTVGFRCSSCSAWKLFYCAFNVNTVGSLSVVRYGQTDNCVIGGCHGLLTVAAGWVSDRVGVGGGLDWIDLAHNRDK